MRAAGAVVAADGGGSGGGGAVTSVNAKTGDVVLDATDVGADASGTATAAVSAHEAALNPHPQYTDATEAAAAAPVQSVNAKTGVVVLDATDVGADASGTATAAVSAHEAALDPHPQYTNPAFGSLYYSSPPNTTPTTISGLAFIPVLVDTSAPLVAGTYRLTWRSALSASSGLGDAGARLLVDLKDGAGLIQRDGVSAYAAATSGAPVTTMWQVFKFTLAAGATPDVQIEAQEYSTGSWTNSRTEYELWRVA